MNKIFCNYCGKESKGGILFNEGFYRICSKCKQETEDAISEGEE